MLYGFFDESGEHHRTSGTLECLTLGGCIASFDQWQSFSVAWGEFLTRHGIKWLHANDAAEADLKAGAAIIAEHIKFCFGLSVHVPSEHRPDPSKRKNGKRAFQTFYEQSVIDMIWEAGRHAGSLRENVELVFAKHLDFSLARIERHFGEFQTVDPRLSSVTSGDPRCIVQLQAADLVAYEAGHYHRDLDMSLPDYMQISSPMRTLIQGGVSFAALSWKMAPPALSRKFLLHNPLPDWP